MIKQIAKVLALILFGILPAAAQEKATIVVQPFTLASESPGPTT